MDNAIYSSLIDILDQEESSRLVRFRQAWDAYYGNFKKPLKVAPGAIDDNILLNFARVIVDKGVSFLFGKSIEFEIDDEQADTWLDDVFNANHKMTLLQKLALNGGVCGTVFIKIILGGPLPRLVILDPETVSVRWQADDIDVVTRYTISYPSRDAATGKPVGIRQVIERNGTSWTIVDQVGDLQTLSWRTVGETTWPYPFAPVIECQNLPAPNQYWGVSDLEGDIVQIMNSINFVLSNMARILRFHAHPKTWGKGFTGSLNVDVDKLIQIPSPDGELHNLEMQSDLGSSIELYLRLKEAMHETARIPEVATGKLDNVGSLSGVALQILYQPLLEKTGTKRLLYGDMLIELSQRLLQIGGYALQDVEIHWPELLPSDPLAERQAALIDQQLGVSQDTLIMKLGYDPDLERQKRETSSAELGDKLLGAFDAGE